jgi:hypothetical protein
MSLSDLASLGSFVSGVAILISLIYVALQLRQSAKHQRSLTNQGYVARITENLRWLAQPANAELRTRINAGETAFTAEELYRLQLLFRTVVLNGQDLYLQHQSGLLDTITFDTFMLGFKEQILSQPVFRAIWMGTARTVAPEFRVVVTTMLAEIPLAKPADAVAQFNANLAKVVG